MKKFNLKCREIMTFGIFAILIITIFSSQIIVKSERYQTEYHPYSDFTEDHIDEPPPRDLYDIDEITDPSTLDYMIELIETTSNDVDVYKIFFHSGYWNGIPKEDWIAWSESGFQDPQPKSIPTNWIISGRLYIPPTLGQDKNYATIGQMDSVNVEPGMDFQKEYGEFTSLQLGILVLLISTPPQSVVDQLGYSDESDLAGHSRLWVLQIGDLRMSAMYAMALSYMRAITFLEKISFENNFDLCDGVVILGSSKRGFSVWIAAAVDARIRGIISCACDLLYVEAGLQNIIDCWYDDNDAVTDAEQKLSLLKTPNGQLFIQHFDPYTIFQNPLLSETFEAMMISGTNDNKYPILSLGNFIYNSSFEKEKVWTYVPNYTHGCGSMKHVIDFRSWITHIFEGRGITHVEHASKIDENNTLHVTATVETQNYIQNVNLIYATKSGGDKDFRQVHWISKSMTQRGEGIYNIELSLQNDVKWIGLYVEAEDIDPVFNMQSFSSSLLEIISPTIKISKPMKAIYLWDKKIIPFISPFIIGDITIEIEILDEKIQLHQIEFYIDGKLKYEDNESSYQWLWDERIFGKHEIKVVVYDAKGNKVEDKIDVIIFNLGLIK